MATVTSLSRRVHLVVTAKTCHPRATPTAAGTVQPVVVAKQLATCESAEDRVVRSSSGNPCVAVLSGQLPLVFGQGCVLDRGDNRPVFADGATLPPGPAEADRLERHPGNPDRREEVALAAPHHDVAPDLVPETACHDRSPHEEGDHEEQGAMPGRRHRASMPFFSGRGTRPGLAQRPGMNCRYHEHGDEPTR